MNENPVSFTLTVSRFRFHNAPVKYLRLFRHLDLDDQIVQLERGCIGDLAGHFHDGADADITGKNIDRGNGCHLFNRIKDMAVVTDS